MEEFRQWINTLAGIGSVVAVAVGILYTLKELRRKTEAETRLTENSKVESDIKLLTLFTKLMAIAHCRGDVTYSKELTEFLLNSQANKKLADLPDKEFREFFVKRSMIAAPVGQAEQEAAICAIAQLGKKHEALKPVALRALTALVESGIPTAQPYINNLGNQAPAVRSTARATWALAILTLILAAITAWMGYQQISASKQPPQARSVRNP